MLLGGVRVILNNYLCERPFVRWARTHRKARINKKWRKRYGAIYANCPGKAWEVAGFGIVVCPHVYEAIKKECQVEIPFQVRTPRMVDTA